MTSFPVSRRRVLKGAAAVACAAAAQSLIPSAALGLTIAPQSTRRNIDSLSSRELAAYEYAVGLLRDKALEGAFPALSHPALRDANATGRPSVCMPWDAEHLEVFEKALRAADPLRTADVSVPYWDFTRPPSGKEYPSAFERVGSPLFVGPDGDTRRLDIVMWSYHAHIDHVRSEWRRSRGPLAQNATAYVWVGSCAVEIRTGTSV